MAGGGVAKRGIERALRRNKDVYLKLLCQNIYITSHMDTSDLKQPFTRFFSINHAADVAIVSS